MSRIKILYLAIELDPFLKRTSEASLSRQLVKANALDYEVRVGMPKCRCISDRKNRLNEVKRLNGINVPMNEKNTSLLVKVAPVPRTRVQSYFMYNEDLFYHRGVFCDDKGVFYKDNHEWIVFTDKSVIVVLEHLGWIPDIIHCIGWPWFFTPMYARIAYKNASLLKKTKIVHTYGASLFKDAFDYEKMKYCMMPNVTDDHLAPMGGKGDFGALVALSKAYADGVYCTLGAEDAEAQKRFEKFDLPAIPYDDNMIEAYRNVYQELLGSKAT